MTTKPKPDDLEQSKRFEETARELDVDESGEAFKLAMEKAVGTRHQVVTAPAPSKQTGNS